MDKLDFTDDAEQQEAISSPAEEIAKMAGLTVGDDSQEPEDQGENADFSSSAIVFSEDDEYVFTSEGVVKKNAVQNNPEPDNSDKSEPDKKILGKFNSYDDLTKAYQNLEKKVGQSSSSVAKLRELEPVLPLLEEMLGDDTFLGMAEKYFSDPEARVSALRSQLGLGEDYVFDLNSALSDPESEDAKILSKIMSANNQKSTSQRQSQQSQQQTNSADVDAFKEKYGLDDSEYAQMMEKAQNHTISHDDIYFIMNKDKVLADARKAAQKEIMEQKNRASSVRKPASGGSGSSNKESPEDVFMRGISLGGGLFG